MKIMKLKGWIWGCRMKPKGSGKPLRLTLIEQLQTDSG